MCVTSWPRTGWRCVFPPLVSICHLGAEDYKDQGWGSHRWGSWRPSVTKRRKTVGLMRTPPTGQLRECEIGFWGGGGEVSTCFSTSHHPNSSILPFLCFFSRQGSSVPLPDSKQRQEVVSEDEYRCWRAGRARGGDKRKATLLCVGPAVVCLPGVANCHAAQRTIVPSSIKTGA